MNTLNGQEIGAVVFDMGGVLVELGPLTEILGDDPLPPEEFWALWLSSPTVRKFEMGRCSAEEFGERLVVEMGLSFSGTELVERFASWPNGLFDGAEQLVLSLGRDVEIAVLSNTNALHWEHQPDHEAVRSMFSRQYLSFELGLAKPDREIFEHVVSDLDVPADHILFLDDNQVNVDGARSVGMRAELVRGIDEARAVLERAGLRPVR